MKTPSLPAQGPVSYVAYFIERNYLLIINEMTVVFWVRYFLGCYFIDMLLYRDVILLGSFFLWAIFLGIFALFLPVF